MMYRCQSECYIGLPWWSVLILMATMGLFMLLVVVLWPRRGPSESGRELVRGRHRGEREPSRWQRWRAERAEARALRELGEEYDEADLRDIIDDADDTPMPPPEDPDFWRNMAREDLDERGRRMPESSGSVTGSPQAPGATPVAPQPSGGPSDKPGWVPPRESFPQESPPPQPRWWLGGKRGRTLHYHTCSTLSRDGVIKTPVPVEFNHDYDTVVAWAEQQNLVMCSRCNPLGLARKQVTP